MPSSTFRRSSKDGWPHEIAGEDGGTDIELSNLPRSIVCQMGVEAMDGFEGSQDVADCELISGWAWDANEARHRGERRCVRRQRLLGTVAANQFRGWLHAVGYGTGIMDSRARRPPTFVTAGTLDSVRISGHEPSIAPHATGGDLSESFIRRRRRRQPSKALRRSRRMKQRGRGVTPAYRNNGDGTIRDVNSGLMWEKSSSWMESATRPPARRGQLLPRAGTCAGAPNAASMPIAAPAGHVTPSSARRLRPQASRFFKWVEQLNATTLPPQQPGGCRARAKCMAS